MTWQRASRWLAIAGIALATPFLVWFAIGPIRPWGPSYEFGPYQVGPDSGPLVVGPAAVIALLSVGVLIVLTRHGAFDFQSWTAVVVVAIAGALGAAGWRVGTSGYSGADIGGPVVLLLDPLLIAGLLVGAVWISGAGGRRTRRQIWLLTVGAALVAPGLFGVMEVLSQ